MCTSSSLPPGPDFAQLSRERNVILALDLHGHSCKRNVFIYGCHAKYWSSVDAESDPPPPALHEQIYPFLLSQVRSEMREFDDKRTSFLFSLPPILCSLTVVSSSIECGLTLSVEIECR